MSILSSKKFMTFLSFFGLYLLSTGASLAIFSYLQTEPSLDLSGDGLKDARSKLNQDLPKTEECPINGKMYTKIEKAIWDDRRPVAAIIENHSDSRPQSGISRADVVYEAVAEGGITRFLSIFYCGAASSDVQIAPVRSARVYFINLAAGYGEKPIFMHVGGANDYSGFGDTAKEARALELLETLGWRVPRGNDFDTTYDSGFPVFWRNYERLDHPVATEHTMMASLDVAHAEAGKRGFAAKDPKGVKWDKNFTPWKFTDDKPVSLPTTEVSFDFWSNKSEYNVTWKYQKDKNSYLRYNGGKPHMDLEGNVQLSAKNVVIMFAKETGPVDKNKHVLYQVIGEGDALIYLNGDKIEGTWEKSERSDMITFRDSKGKEVSFVKGEIWVEVVPEGNDILTD